MADFAALGLTSAATATEVKDRWRDLARVHHPDRGGDPAEFARLHAIYQECWVKAQNRRCTECGGRGKITIHAGFVSMKTTCKKCHGSGKS